MLKTSLDHTKEAALQAALAEAKAAVPASPPDLPGVETIATARLRALSACLPNRHARI